MGILRLAPVIIGVGFLAWIVLVLGVLTFPFGAPLIYIAVLSIRLCIRLLLSQTEASLRRLCTLVVSITTIVSLLYVVAMAYEKLGPNRNEFALWRVGAGISAVAAMVFWAAMKFHRFSLRDAAASFRWSAGERSASAGSDPASTLP